MAGTTVVVKRTWPKFTSHATTGVQMPFEQAVYEAINDIITDLETLRAAGDAINELLGADTGVTDSDYHDAAQGLTIDAASDLSAYALSTPEAGD